MKKLIILLALLIPINAYAGIKSEDSFTGKKIAKPSNPSSGYDKMYFKSDEKLYGLTSAGVEALIGPSGGGTPGGSNTQVQFNDSSAFGGDAEFTYNKTSNRLGIGTTSPQYTLDVVSAKNDGISLVAGGGISTNDGGSILLTSGSSESSSSTRAGDITLTGGTGTSIGAVHGGFINLIAGAGRGTAGQINLTSGAASGSNSTAGSINITTLNGIGAGDGGDITATTGTSSGGGRSGNLLIPNGNVGIGTASPNEQLEITKNFRMPATTATAGIIYYGNSPFIHNYHNAATDGYNTFIGLNAGNLTMTGGASYLGSSNTAIGYAAFNRNTTGYANNTVGVNTLFYNTTGHDNSAQGANAMVKNTTGYENVAMGSNSLFNNTTGSGNNAFGANTLFDLLITDGTGNNTALGNNTGRGIVTGVNNTIIGANVTGLDAALSNTIIIADGAGNQRIYVNAGTWTLTLPVDDGTTGQLLSTDGNGITSWATIGSVAKWTTARNLAGNSVDGSANVAFSNKFIVQGTSDASLSGAQFLGALGTGIVKNTTTTGVLSIAVAGDFPTLNQDTTGKSAKTDALNSATTVVNVASATAPSSGQVLTATSSTAATWQTPSGGGSQTPWTANVNADGYTLYGNDGANESLTLEGTSNATKTTSYVILQPTAGNVGINTTAPVASLQVKGTTMFGDIVWPTTTFPANVVQQGTKTPVLISNNASGITNLFIHNAFNTLAADNGGYIYLGARATTSTNNAAYVKISGARENAASANYATYFQVQTQNSGAGVNDGIRMDSDGNVTIGSTTPFGRLTLGQGSGRVFNMNGAGTGYQYMSMDNTGGNWNLALNSSVAGTLAGPSLAYATILYGTNATALQFGTNSTIKMTILSGGNVGIGTNAPTAILHLKSSTGAAGLAPIKFTAGTLLGTPEAGAMEFDTDALYVTTTTGTKRRMLAAGITGRAATQTAANASVATYTLGAADASYEVSANVLVTTSGTEAFTVTCSYTDESNTARVITLPFILLAGTTTANIAFANGAVPYEGIPVHIRCKASTAITVKTAAGGTYTGCTYNVESVIKQTA